MVDCRPLFSGMRLSLTMLTVLPLPAGRLERRSAAVAIAVAPLVGAVLGLSLGGIGLGAAALGASPLVCGVVVVAAGLGLTRGIHIDGLADTFDALGSYRDPDAALTIMRSPGIGPFGVAAIAVVIVAQVAALAAVVARPWPAVLAAVTAATASGRVGITIACRRGIPAARADGLGAMVAGTVGWWPGGVGMTAVAVAALAAVPGRPWQGVLAVAVGLAGGNAILGHAVRRLRGVTGDVLGAVCEATVTLTLVVASA